ncbi:hypothetical protein Anas_04020, partial [Armadillidium nasatum]
ASPWGDAAAAESSEGFGFGDDAKFDPFLSLNEPPPVPQSTPRKVKRDDSKDSDDTPMNVVLGSSCSALYMPSAFDGSSPIPPTPSPVPVLAPPPAVLSASFTDSTPRFNPFDKTAEDFFGCSSWRYCFPCWSRRTSTQRVSRNPSNPSFRGGPIGAPRAIFKNALRWP